VGNILLSVCACSELDYDYVPDHKYEFVVTATDGGSPPLSGSATVQVSDGFLIFNFLISLNTCADDYAQFFSLADCLGITK